jgi:hypothetical protein
MSENGEQKPGPIAMALAGVVITIMALAALLVIFAVLGIFAAVAVESYWWWRESLSWT